MNIYSILGILVWGMVLFALFLVRPKSKLHQVSVETASLKYRILIFMIIAGVILGCTLPMGWLPIWDGRYPDYTKQYEVMAESLYNGHLYLYDEADPLLSQMENPYDPEARAALEVSYWWDHAFYDGKYYMYFGVVPAFLVFLPYRIITGHGLVSYHATQIFVAFFIFGVFTLFHMIAKKYFPKIPLSTYVILSTAFSIMSIWYSISVPALYCTAITSALCLEIWSLYFFARAVWIEKEQKKTIIYAFFGSLLGALTFGCRPPIALANLFVLPLLAEYLRERKMDFKLFRQLFVAASPYIVIGILLMLYNYVRFGTPFEFGSSYQLTLVDQSSYGNILDRMDMGTLIKTICMNFVSFDGLEAEFPYITANGAFVNFPILLFPAFAVMSKKVRKYIKEKHLTLFIESLFIIPLVITVADTIWSEFQSERYRMDIYWLMGILCFFAVGIFYIHLPEKTKQIFNCVICVLGFITVGSSIMLYLAESKPELLVYSPNALRKIRLVLTLGIGA